MGPEATATIAKEGAQATATLISGILNYLAVEDANQKNYALAQVTRQDNLEARRAAQVLADKSFGLQERSQKFSEKESKENRAERAEERGYNRAQSSFNRAAQLWSQQLNANQMKTAPFVGRVK